MYCNRHDSLRPGLVEQATDAGAGQPQFGGNVLLIASLQIVLLADIHHLTDLILSFLHS